MSQFSNEDMNGFLIFTSERADLGILDSELSELTRPRQVFRLVWDLESEVNNGGFFQYGYNGSGEGAPLCAMALREIGANATAEIVDDAVAIMGDIPWADWDARQAAVEGLSEAQKSSLDQLDQRFFGYPDNLTNLLFQYVLAHLGEFPKPPE